jgi:cobalt/nickel transport system ATP-binding protein
MATLHETAGRAGSAAGSAAGPDAPERAERRFPAPARPVQAPGASPVEPVVSVHGLRHVYEDGTEVDYGDRPLEIAPGERVVLLGPNGSGKSTLLLHVLGLLTPRQGDVRVFGLPAAQLPPAARARIAVLLQQVDEQIIGPTVWDDVAFTPRNMGLSRPDVDRLVEAALRRLDIWPLRAKVPHALSVGERRKVALAGAIVLSTPPAASGGAGQTAFGPALVVLDEPFASLDPRSRATLLALIEELRRDHRAAVLMTTHWVEAVPDLADRIYVLAPGGRITASGTPEEVFSRPDALEALDVEPPVLSQLFRSLERRGISLPPAYSVERAADALASYCRAGRRLPSADRSRGRPGPGPGTGQGPGPGAGPNGGPNAERGG